MIIELREINELNKQEIIDLEVEENQKQFIASNEKSLQTAKDNKSVARPFAIYADDVPVGFAMFAFDFDYDDPDDRFWLWRFMIDKNHQGKDFGAAALEIIIRYFRDNGANNIKLSTKESNAAALSLYHKFGFMETGEMNGEEAVLKLDL